MIALALIGITLAVFWPVGGNEFLNYDDTVYVTQNPSVQNGLGWEGVLWAFSSFHTGNWHPVTWLSHMLDVNLFGLNPAGHHWMNLLFHLANVLLLFFLLKRMTHALWPSALVATLFAVHPLHVESVAWIAERKDVLSAFFGLLTLWAYVGYVEKRGLRPESRKAMLSYLAVLLFFTLSLMAKPMLVTLPFLMLLLDYWPLRRTSFKFQVSSFKFLNLKPETLKPETDFNQPGTRNQKPETRNLIFEKLPLLALAALSGVVTFLAQQKGGSVTTLEQFSLPIRIGNAIVSYVLYLWKMLWPLHLAVFYPHPGESLPVRQVVGAALLLLLISTAVIRMTSERPFLIVGWLWYLLSLIPVIGIVQVGAQAMADRYTYLPLIGIFIMIAWSLSPPLSRTTPAVAAGIVLLLFATTARTQVGYWKDSVTLNERALEVTSGNYIAHHNLGLALAERGKYREAVVHYVEAAQYIPRSEVLHHNLGLALAAQGNLEEAIAHFSEATRLNPDSYAAHNDLGVALARLGKAEEAIAHFTRAVAIDPLNAEAHNSWGVALLSRKRFEQAAAQFSLALSIQPDYIPARYNLGLALTEQGKLEEAITQFTAALRAKPDDPLVRRNLEVVSQRLEKERGEGQGKGGEGNP